MVMLYPFYCLDFTKYLWRSSPAERQMSIMKNTWPSVDAATSRETQSMQNVICYDAAQVEYLELNHICKLRASGNLDERVTWAHVSGPFGPVDIRSVASSFGFHELVVEDILGDRQRPKVEVYGQQLFLILRAPDISSGQFRTRQLSILRCHNAVLSFEDGEMTIFDSVRKRIDDPMSGFRGKGPDYLIYSLVDAVIDAYFPVVDRISESVSTVEASLAEEASVKSITRLQTLRSTLFLLREALEPHQELVSQLRRSTGHIGEEASLYFRDVSDHLSQVLHATEVNRELAADLRDYCFAELSFNQNETMKLLTVVASVFIPLGFIVGLYGMNFDPEVSSWNMPELRWRYGYIIALGLMVTVVVLSLGTLFLVRRFQRKTRASRFARARSLLFDRDEPLN